MADDAAKAKADRIRSLLSNYYGAGESAAPTASTGSDRPLAKTSVSGVPTLNPEEQHIADILRTYPLERLLTEHRSMAREIKNLDSDMQQLIYENYSRFINATDTIRQMKASVDGMGGDMDKLKEVMENVSEKTNSVCVKLKSRRESMEELQKVQSVLKKLQAVFDLPKKMRAALEGDMLDTAVSFYAEAQPLLQKYGNRGTFRHISAEADVVAREISQLLKRRLTERKDSEEQCVLLLRKLGEPDDTLQDKYLQGRAHRLRCILREASVVVDAMAVGASNTGNSGILSGIPSEALISRGVEQPASWAFSLPSIPGAQAGGLLQPPSLKQFVRVLDEKVINAMQETVVNVLRFFLQGDAQSPVKRKSLVALSREVFGEYFKIAKRALADAIVISVHRAARLAEAAAHIGLDGHNGQGAVIPNFGPVDGAHMELGEDWGTEAIVQALSTLSADLGLLHSHLPELALKDRAMATVSTCVERHITTCFAAVSSRALGGVSVVQSRLDSAAGVSQDEQLLRKGYAYCSSMIQRGLASVMVGLRPYDSPASVRLMGGWREGYVDLVQGRLQRLLLSLLKAFMSTANLRYDGSDLLRAALQPPSSNVTNVVEGEDDTFSGNSDALELIGSAPLMRQTPGSSVVPTALVPGVGDNMASKTLSANNAKTGVLLLLAKMCSYLEQNSVPWVMEALAASSSLSQQQRYVANNGSGGAAAGDLLPPAFVPGEVARRLNAASSALLEAYVEMHGRQLSVMVRRSVASTNWLNHREPRGPRPVCDLQLERISKAESEVIQLVEDSGRGRADERKGRTAAMGGLDANLALETGNVERNLAKIFREKVKVFGSVQFTQAHILAAITGIGLKSLVECVRLVALGRAGLQQLQLDCHYLRPPLRRLTGGTGPTAQIVDSLLDEVVSAGVERCVEPSLLEIPVLDRILTAMDS